MPKKRRSPDVPPICVGCRVTYTPEGASFTGPVKMDTRAILLSLTLDGKPVDAVGPYIHDRVSTPRVFGRLRLSDGSEVDAPMKVFSGDAPAWTRPWITHFTARY